MRGIALKGLFVSLHLGTWQSEANQHYSLFKVSGFLIPLRRIHYADLSLNGYVA
jgi:hypothetical protein